MSMNVISEQTKRRNLDVMGVSVVEHCNLNCKGCLHFCHSGQEPWFCNISTFESDLKRLHEFFETINVIRLYGGEPFLSKFLGNFIFIAKKIFPKSTIEILTNGTLLIGNKSIPFLEVMQQYHIKLIWSLYPIIFDKTIEINRIIAILKNHNIEVEINKCQEFFACYNPKGNSDGKAMYKVCYAKHCHMLRNGFISGCPAPLVSHLSNILGANINCVDDVLNIYDHDITADKILSFLNSSHNICAFCSPPRYFKWKQSHNPKIEDWYGQL